jgi:multiple sugar transport system permease protein
MFMGVYTMNWGDVATATILASLPVVVAAVIAQRLIVRGLTAGAVKG